ncbi:flavin reductase [Rhizobium rhizosphaerae]|uniref:Flavin reductase n=1 Tax=Xaviernesmea rhizosphaerae TaxID=1672749 RepID=A0A1Q9ADA2_9HYPH|nr:flavin reductase family protein [Xaviernesmea rhizosphaerae]OLP52906.1 flavin reductase [Xaviernesmea rhizosphaerae]OQP86517.1 flavin reductase [Xaviernesmea rhizosphaerae]
MTLVTPLFFPAQPLPPVEDHADALKAAMRHVAATVSVITAGTQDRTGATVTSATALSVEPATMIVNINRTSSSWPVIARHGHFCVNILQESQQAIADRFAGKGGLKGAERYQDAEWTVLSSGAPVLADALFAIDCVLEEAIERHSHAILIGRVVAVSGEGGTPLLYRQGQYSGYKP